MPDYDAILHAPLCHLGACFSGEALTRLDFLPQATAASGGHDPRARRLAAELDTYWRDPSHTLDVPYALRGTPFQLRVWQALAEIPSGQSTTYGHLAKQLDTAARAVGQACGSNPLPLIVPCHRVVAANGLGGFMHAAAGAPLDVKTWLLSHERGGASTVRGSGNPCHAPAG